MFSNNDDPMSFQSISPHERLDAQQQEALASEKQALPKSEGLGLAVKQDEQREAVAHTRKHFRRPSRSFKSTSTSHGDPAVHEKRSPLRISAVFLARPDGSVLFAKRHLKDIGGGQWELPGGKREPHESSADCAIREVQEEVGVQIKKEQLRFLGLLYHDFGTHQVNVSFYYCSVPEDLAPQALASSELLWAIPEEMLQTHVVLKPTVRFIRGQSWKRFMQKQSGSTEAKASETDQSRPT